MSRNVWTIVIISCMSLTGSWVYMGLFSTQVSEQSENLHVIMDEVERDMGTYNPDSARLESPIQRAKNAAAAAQLLAQQKNREMDSLANAMQRMSEEEIGYGTLNDSVEPATKPTATFTDDGVLILGTR